MFGFPIIVIVKPSLICLDKVDLSIIFSICLYMFLFCSIMFLYICLGRSSSAKSIMASISARSFFCLFDISLINLSKFPLKLPIAIFL